MHRSILFYLHLLISGLHHHFSIQCHHPPLAGIPFKSTITAYRNTDIPVTRRHYDTISPFQPPLHPHPERKDIFYFLQPLPPFLFLILLPFPLYALRTPPGFLPQTFHHGGKIRFARLRSITSYIPLPLSFLHMIIVSFPVHHHNAPIRQTTTTPVHLFIIPFQHAGEDIKYSRPHRIN